MNRVADIKWFEEQYKLLNFFDSC